MIVVTMTNCPPKLRGDLSKWLLEINTGVYVGQVSARVREALWKRICENIGTGQATMVFTANNEQHMDFYVHNTPWKPVDLDGIKLMKHPIQGGCSDGMVLKQGFSDAAKQRMGKKRRKKVEETSYVVLDIETTGLSYEKDAILEIGIITVKGGSIIHKAHWLIRSEETIPEAIQKLTGIDHEMVIQEGVELKDALKTLFALLHGKTVLLYNAGFDLLFLEENARRLQMHFPEVKILDVMALAKSRLKGLDNYKLDTVAAHFAISCAQRHRALADCQITHMVYQKLNEI